MFEECLFFYFLLNARTLSHTQSCAKAHYATKHCTYLSASSLAPVGASSVSGSGELRRGDEGAARARERRADSSGLSLAQGQRQARRPTEAPGSLTISSV